MQSASYAIGIDLGGTKIEIALVDRNGVIRKKQRCRTRVADGPQEIQKDIAETVNELIGDLEVDVVGAGVGIAGQVSKETGDVHFAPNLEWRDVPLQQELAELLELPVTVANDVRAAAWGEWMHGAGQGCRDMICVFVGTGIGGGIVSGGQMLTGDTNAAGEIGHMVIDRNGPFCTCGNQGCWEAIAGGWAIAKRARQEITNDPKKGAALLKYARGHQGAVTAATVSEAYNEKDPLAEKIIKDVSDALTEGLISLVNCLGPRRLILGGGIISGNPFLMERIEKGVKKRALNIAVEKLEIVEAKLGNDAPVIGAASLAWQLFGAEEKASIAQERG